MTNKIIGVNCCSNEKEPPEITIYKPENNYSTIKKNHNSEKIQQNELIIVNPIQSTQIQGSICPVSIHQISYKIILSKIIQIF